MPRFVAGNQAVLRGGIGDTGHVGLFRPNGGLSATSDNFRDKRFPPLAILSRGAKP